MNEIKTDTLSILKIALPISVGTLVQFLVLLTDNYFLASVGESAINGAGNAGLTYLTFGMLIFGSSTGIQILVAKRNGENNEELQLRTGRTGWVIQALLGAVLCAIVWSLNQGILESLIASKEVKDVFTPFLNTRLWGFIPYGITFAITAYWTGLARTNFLLAVSLTTAFTNLILDYVLIEGNLGFEAMGFIGAARASLAAEIIGFVVAIIVMFKVDKRFCKLPTHVDTEIIKSWLKISAPLMGQLLLTVGTWTSFFFFVEKVGSTELKISHIGRNAFMFAFIITSGIAQTTRTIIPTLIGAKRHNNLMPTIKRLFGINVTGILLLSHGYIFYPEIISSLFFESQQHIGMMSKTFNTIFIATIGFGLSSLLLATLEGAGGTKRAFIIEMIAASSYLLGAIYFTTPQNGQFFEIHQIWRIEWIYFTTIAFGCLFVLRDGKWKFGLESFN